MKNELNRKLTIRCEPEVFKPINELLTKELVPIRTTKSEIIRAIIFRFISNLQEGDLIEFRRNLISYRKKVKNYPKVIGTVLTEDMCLKLDQIKRDCPDLDLRYSQIIELILYVFFKRFKDNRNSLIRKVIKLIIDDRIRINLSTSLDDDLKGSERNEINETNYNQK